MSTLRTNAVESITGTATDFPNSLSIQGKAIGTIATEPTSRFPYVVGSVAELAGLSVPEEVNEISLLGYYGIGTLGGGPLFRSTEEPDGGLVLSAADGSYWARPKSDVVRAVWYGFGGTRAQNVSAFSDAYDAAVDAGFPLELPAGRYLFSGLTKDLPARGQKVVKFRAPAGPCTLIVAGNNSLILRPPSENYTASATVAEGSREIQVANPEEYAVGDVLLVKGSDISDTIWGYAGSDTTIVTGIDGGNLFVSKKFRFTHSSATINRWKAPEGVSFEDIWFEHSGDVTGVPAPLTIAGAKNITLKRYKFRGSVPYTDTDPVRLNSCVGVRAYELDFSKCRYGVLASGGSDHQYNEITGNETRHPIVPSEWCDGVIVCGVRGDNNQGIIDSHSAFDVFYEDVYTETDARLSNNRSIGGGIKDIEVRCVSTTEPSNAPYFQSLDLNNASADDYHAKSSFVADSVKWTAINTLRIWRGNIRTNNVRSFDLDGNEATIIIGLSSDTSARSLSTTNMDSQQVSARMNRGVKSDTSVINAQLDGGVYVVDPAKMLASRENGNCRISGEVFHRVAAGSVTGSLRIHTNFTQTAEDPDFILGVLKLRAFVLHNNAGGYDIKEKWFHFRHKKVQFSGVALPPGIAFEDSPTGQSNESLDITLSNPTQVGQEVGSNVGQYVQFDFSVTSGRTSPRYSLYFDLDMTGLN